MKRRLIGWLAAVALVTMPSVGMVQAAIVPLSDLLQDGATIQSGDKTFSNFEFLRTGDMPTAENINVETIQDTNGDYGIRFQGGFIDQPGGDASDVLVRFSVSVPIGSPLAIDGVTLSANPAVFEGPGLASVTETFLPEVDDQLMVIYDFGDGNHKLLDSITFDQPFTTLHVQKDVILHAIGDTGAATMSFFDQTFSQVPEPSSMVLVLGGLLGLLGCRKRS